MIVEYELTRKGDREYNEDAYGYVDNLFWVIDGATPITSSSYFSSDDTHWYVQELNSAIMQEHNSNDSLLDIIQKAVEKVRCIAVTKNENITLIESWKLPSFTIAMGRIFENILEYYVLGDCGIYVDDGTNSTEITDNRIERFSLINRTKLFEKICNSKSISEEDENAIYCQTRRCMNKPYGYWVGSVDGKGLSHGINGSITVNQSNFKCIIYSDGFMEAISLFKIASLNEGLFDKKAIESVVNNLEQSQKNDLERKEYVRVRQIDDLTIIYVRGEQS